MRKSCLWKNLEPNFRCWKPLPQAPLLLLPTLKRTGNAGQKYQKYHIWIKCWSKSWKHHLWINSRFALLLLSTGGDRIWTEMNIEYLIIKYYDKGGKYVSDSNVQILRRRLDFELFGYDPEPFLWMASQQTISWLFYPIPTAWCKSSMCLNAYYVKRM